MINNFEVKKVPRALIDRNPWNRDVKKDASFDLLLADIKEHGIETPLSLRQKEDGRYEIMKGERRWTCAGELEHEEVPAFVAAVGDVDAYLALLRDNLQREMLTPMQEATAYGRLLKLKDTGGEEFTPERIAARVNQNIYTVYRRLKLVNVPKDVAKALDEGRIPERVAYLIGRLPTEALRGELAKAVLHPKYGDTGAILNVKQTEEYTNEHLMVSLKGVKFDLEDATLTPDLGSCMGCPHLAKNDPGLAAELSAGAEGKRGGGSTSGIAALTCMHPEHFRLKMAAYAQRTLDEAAKENREVIPPKEVKKLFPGDGNRLDCRAGLESLDDKPGYSETGHWDNEKNPTYKKIIEKAEKAGISVPVRILAHPKTHEIIELVDHKKVMEAARQVMPEIFKKGGGGAGKKSDEEIAANKAKKERDKLKGLLTYEAAKQLQQVIGKDGLGLEGVDMLLRIALHNSGSDGQFFFGKLLGVEAVVDDSGGWKRKDLMTPLLTKVAELATTVNSKLGYLALALMARGLKWNGVHAVIEKDEDEDAEPGFEHLALHLGLDLLALEKRLKAELKEKAKPKPKTPSPKKGGKPEMKSKSKAVQRNEGSVNHEETANFKLHADESGTEAAERASALLDAKAARKKAAKGSKADRLKERLKTPGTTAKTPKKGKLSAEAREQIAAAQRLRWAKLKSKAAKGGKGKK